MIYSIMQPNGFYCVRELTSIRITFPSLSFNVILTKLLTYLLTYCELRSN